MGNLIYKCPFCDIPMTKGIVKDIWGPDNLDVEEREGLQCDKCKEIFYYDEFDDEGNFVGSTK